MADLSTLSTEGLERLKQSNPGLSAAIDQELSRRNAGGAKSYARALGQAAFNLGDEFEAWARNGFSTGGDYDLIKSQINSEIQQSYQDNPGLYALEFGAGMAIPGAGLFKLGKGANTIRGMMARGAGVGFADGALGGYGASTDGNELSGTLFGGGLGALTGGAFSGAVPAVSRLAAGQTDPEQIIRDIAQRHGISAEDVREQMNRLGPDAVLADAFPAFAHTAQGAATKAPFSPALRELTERQQGARDRLVNEIEGETGTTGADARRITEELKQERSRVGNEDYAPVDSASFDRDSVAILLNDPLVSKEINDSLKAYASERGISLKALKEALYESEEAVQVPARILADARSMVSDRANLLAERGEHALARKYKISLGRFDERLDEVPGYTQANANYSRASDEIEAIQTGRDIGRNGRGLSDEEAILNEVTDPVLRNYIGLGARSQIANDIRASGGLDGTGSPLSRLGSDEVRDLRLKAGQVEFLEDALGREARFNETFNTVDPKRGSATAMRNEAASQFESDTALAGALTEGSIVGVAREAWKKFVGEKLNIRSKKVANSVLDLLLKKGMSKEQIMSLINNPNGATELANFIKSGRLQLGTAAATGAALQTGGLLYEQN